LLVSTFCVAWLERSRRKTTLATMDKVGQMWLALERERRKLLSRTSRQRLPGVSAERASSDLPSED